MSRLLVRNIGELCTCDSERGDAPGVVKSAALIAEDGVLTYVGEERGLTRSLEVDTEIDVDGRSVIPGFVDAHTHIVWLGERSAEYAQRAAGVSYEQIALGDGGIATTVRATTAGTVDALTAAAAERARRMRSCGTTTVEVKSGYGIDTKSEVRQLEAASAVRALPGVPDIVTTYLPLHATPDGEHDKHVQSVIDTGIAEARDRATFIDVFCDPMAYSVDECERVLVAAQNQGMRAKVHAEQRSRNGGALLAARLGAVSADHLEHAEDGDLRSLAAASVVCVLLPGAALVLGGPPPPGRRALEAGATIAIATDCNPGTCFCESMPLMMSLAVATAGITPAQALVAATAGGAAALSLSDRGVLRTGKRCDVALLTTPHWMDCAYHMGGDVVGGTLVAGESTLR
ncbi:MAG: imidazolonepropionase [Candidatus Dormibacteraeota bacterium]|nr:imidazolonepropionase [Candidatus Dormibacteraeota bacterium]MBV8445402.1 imidazolonepropionase [Candidatus Dormibacteraeota bacterium]